jgi:endoglucanase
MPDFGTLELPPPGLVAPAILALSIPDGRVEHGGHEPYVPQASDTVTRSGSPYATHVVRRDGEPIGVLVGKNRDILARYDRLVGRLSSRAWLDQATSYAISSAEDPTYGNGVSPTRVERKTKPNGLALTGLDDYEVPQVHTIYLHLPAPLSEGQEYRIEYPESGGTQSFRFASRSTTSEAIHVSAVGFDPRDPRKIGFMSCWRGTGGGTDYGDSVAYEVVRDGNGEVVLTGRSVLTVRWSDGEDAYDRNFSHADVHLLDFSSLNQEGTYRLVVPGIGASPPFDVETGVWQRAFRTNARGLYHQRSGTALGAPHTSYTKPRDFHPEDGRSVFHSSCPLMDSGNGLNARGTESDNFACLVKGKTNELVPNAWGGYHDAGDWDRRIQHLVTSRGLFELTELFPATMSQLSLGIPESDNALPDVMDEALWGLDLYRRLQTPAGGVRGGVESDGHPLNGETSWIESRAVMAYAPDIWSSYLYAATAARAAFVLRDREGSLAQQYQESALRAADWAENERQSADYYPLPYEVNDARNLAAAGLYRLTGDERWHTLFRQTNKMSWDGAPLEQWSSREDNSGYSQQDAAFLYLLSADLPRNETLVHRFSQAFRDEADKAMARMSRTGFRWVKSSDWAWVAWGTLGASQARLLVQAHHLTGDRRYLEAALEASQFSLGANPGNQSYTTGLGRRTVRKPWVVNPWMTQQNPGEGITVYGPADPEHVRSDYWYALLAAPNVHPPAASWPANEHYFDMYSVFAMNEFTVQETLAPNIYVLGYLAGAVEP